MWCFVGKSGRRIKTDHHRASGQLQTTGAHTRSVDAWEWSRQQKKIRKRSPHKKKSHGTQHHKSTCVICLGTFVMSAGACDFIALAWYFSNLAGFEAQHSPWPTPEEPEALDRCSILSMQKRFRLTIRFVRNFHWSLLAHAAVRLLHA